MTSYDYSRLLGKYIKLWELGQGDSLVQSVVTPPHRVTETRRHDVGLILLPIPGLSLSGASLPLSPSAHVKLTNGSILETHTRVELVLTG